MLNEEYRSDKRIKGGVTDECKLCGQSSILRLSHIAPKWMYSFLKSETEKGHIIGNYESLDVYDVIAQDGSKHYMLCDSCEQILGDAENYVKDLMTRKSHEINSELIQRFVLGIAYKSHFATSAPFHKIHIKNKYLLYLKESILKKEFRGRNFVIAAMGFESKDGINSTGIVSPSDHLFPKGTYQFTLLGGGWEWVLLINKNNKFTDCPVFRHLRHQQLREGQNFNVPRGDITDHRTIQKRIKKQPTSNQ
jgi:hypothetical protein